MINAAFEAGMVSADTVQTFKAVPKLLKKNSNKRNRVLSVEEFDRLIKVLPRHTVTALAIGFYMGMRKGEIVSIQWKQVDFVNRYIRLRADQTKDAEPRNIFICDTLLEILQSLPRGEDEDYVVTHRGKPVRDLRTGLIDGCKKANIIYGRFKEGGFVVLIIQN